MTRARRLCVNHERLSVDLFLSLFAVDGQMMNNNQIKQQLTNHFHLRSFFGPFSGLASNQLSITRTPFHPEFRNHGENTVPSLSRFCLYTQHNTARMCTLIIDSCVTDREFDRIPEEMIAN